MEHSIQVQEWAVCFCKSLDFLDRKVADDVATAAFLHDLGKSDERFQRYLMGPWIPEGEVKAKSGKLRSWREEAAAKKMAALPDRWRHEALSVRIAERFNSHINDLELVLWLIGVHHGQGRARFPHDDPHDDRPRSYYGFGKYDKEHPLEMPAAPGPQRSDFILTMDDSKHGTIVNWQTMFARLKHRYGVWALAFLESIVRLADHRASESASLPQKGDGDAHVLVARA